MRLHELRSKTKQSSKKRVGRGGKRGTYSGKGQKGQKSRAGHKIRPGQRDVLLRTPKLKGFKNKPKKTPARAISLSVIDAIESPKISFEILRVLNIVSGRVTRVKIVGSGSITNAKEIVGIPVSASAKKKIEDAGGSVSA